MNHETMVALDADAEKLRATGDDSNDAAFLFDEDTATMLARNLVDDDEFVAAFLNQLAERIHADNVAAGWWTNPQTGESILHSRNVPEMLMLIVSEISEAMEGYRKNLMDDKLAHRPMLTVELADAMIRILDLAGSRMAIERAHPFGTVLQEKRSFNAGREDHRIENRMKQGGKAF